MNRQQPLNRLELDEDALFHHQICPECALDPEIVIDNRNGNLAFESDSSLAQFVREALAVGALEQSRAEVAVYREGCAKYTVCEFSG